MRHIKKITKAYGPAITLERVLPFRSRRLLRTVLSFLTVFSLVALFFVGFVDALFGLFLILFALWAVMFMLHSFYNSYYLEGLEGVLDEHKFSRESLHDTRLEVAYIIDRAYDHGLLWAFVDTVPGELVLARADAPMQEVLEYAKSASKLSPDLLEGMKYVNLAGIAKILLKDSGFKDILFKNGVQEKDFIGAAGWVDRIDLLHRKNIRNWGRDHLGRIPGLGKDWSYAEAYTLEKYGTFAEDTKYYTDSMGNEEEVEKEVRALESVLARREGSNALLLGDSLEGLMSIVGRTAYHIAHGSILPSLQHKRVFILDLKALVSAHGDKASIETALLGAFDDALGAGNIVIAIDDLSGAVSSAKAYEVDVLSVIDSYLASSGLQVVGTSLSNLYFGSLENNSYVQERFEVIQTTRSTREELVRDLEDIVPLYEASYKIFVTYPALESIARHAEEHFGYGILSDKVNDLLEELVPFVLGSGRSVVRDTDVAELVEAKTGIPVTELKTEEKVLLLNLENELHTYVVGQDLAVKSLASALQRARSQVNTNDRPMGSFLFLGPTGVGKTETAKALARVMFGGEEKMMRFDMSEYTGADALSKLTGSFEGEKTGVLVKGLRQNPYGVVLLDEFEKTSDEVKDLFLQIFDEGVFSDMAGRRVFARDSIFIATSNAASSTIWNYFNEGKKPEDHKEDLIDTMIQEGLFKPELLNRFDDVLVFHPLEKDHLLKIAKLMLESLRKRLYAKGTNVVLDEDVATYVVENGYDPKFGARPMNRVIQDDIEGFVARKKLEGSIMEGGTLNISASDL